MTGAAGAYGNGNREGRGHDGVDDTTCRGCVWWVGAGGRILKISDMNAPKSEHSVSFRGKIRKFQFRD